MREERKKIPGKALTYIVMLLLIACFSGCKGITASFGRGNTTIDPLSGAVGTSRTGKGIAGRGPASGNVKVDGRVIKDAYFDQAIEEDKPGGNETGDDSWNTSIERYLVEAKDVLNIQVRGEPDLNTTSRVNEKGEIWFPLLETVKVAGLPLQGIEKLIERRLEAGFLNDPKVTVRIDVKLMEEYREKEVFVSGQVKSPGAIPLLGKYITVFEAVNKAGGVTDIAWPSRTKVIREENGVKSVIRVNLNKVRKGDKSEDIIVRPGDIIVVPEALF